jgi:hypothetical protein
VPGEFQVQINIVSQIQDHIERALRNAIIINANYLDDEQLSCEGQFEALTTSKSKPSCNSA